MTRNMKRLGMVLGAALTLGGGTAMAESQYGYASSGTPGPTAQANVKLKVTVPLLILLRVGAAGGPSATDDIAWTTGYSVPSAPVTPVNGSNQPATWTGVAPTAGAVTSVPTPAKLTAYAWTNSAGGGRLTCTAPTWTAVPATAVGPANADITVVASAAASLNHPGGDLTCGTPFTFTKNVVATSDWTYTLGGTPATWGAGSYTATVLYTATSI